MEFQELFHLAKSGKLHSWKVWTEGSTVFSIAGTVDGKKITSQKITTPKNTGKVNATTAEEQADKEAKAMWQAKLDRKYSLNKEDAKIIETIKPMLALDFTKRKGKFNYPVDISPKLDGARAVAYWEDGKVILKSRGDKEWVCVTHLNEEISKFLPENMVLDGEIFIKDVDFQTLMSWAKRKQPDTSKLEYHVYDMPLDENGENQDWQTRRNNLIKFFKGNTFKYLKPVSTYEVVSEEEALKYHSNFVNDGYEGAMIRILDGKYLSGYRSQQLLKLKSFDDDEFEIIGYTRGIGKFADSVIWSCKTENNLEFKVIPKCTQEQKEEYLRHAEDYVGQFLTVQYFGLSNEGVPRFPIGIKFKTNLEDERNK